MPRTTTLTTQQRATRQAVRDLVLAVRATDRRTLPYLAARLAASALQLLDLAAEYDRDFRLDVTDRDMLREASRMQHWTPTDANATGAVTSEYRTA